MARVTNVSLLFGLALFASACAGPPSPFGTGGRQPTGRFVAGTAASSGPTSGTSGGLGSSGGTAGSSGGGSTTSAACGQAFYDAWVDGGYLPGAGECAAGQVELKGRLSNVCLVAGSVAPPITDPFSAGDAQDPSVMATTAPCGVYWYCVDAGTALTPSFQLQQVGQGYPLGVQLATLDLTSSGTPSDNEARPGLYLYCSSILSALFSGLNPALSTAQALVLVTIPPGDSAACDNAGWSFSLFGPDGGALSVPFFFVGGAGLAPADGGTTGEGVEVFYNIPPAIQSVTLTGDKPGNDLPDGGRLCADARSIPGVTHFTGQIPVAATTVTYALYPTR